MTPDSANYFYSYDKCHRRGPVGFDELRALAEAGDLTRRHKVWCEGMPGWETADKINGLFAGLPPDLDNEMQGEASRPVPPPLPEEESKTPPPEGDVSSPPKPEPTDREDEHPIRVGSETGSAVTSTPPIAVSAQQPSFDVTRTTPLITTKTCDYCGRVNADAATHCSGCGTELASAPANSIATQADAKPSGDGRGIPTTPTAPLITTKTCDYCGRVSAEAATHCLGCGTELASATSDATGNPPVATARKMRRMILVCSAAVTLVLVGILFAVHKAKEVQKARELHTAQAAEALGRARELIAAGLQEIVYENAGDNIAFDSRRLPVVLEKWEQALITLRPVRPANVTVASGIHFDLDRAIVAARNCQQAIGYAEKANKLESFVRSVSLLAGDCDLPNPFDRDAVHNRSASSRPTLPGNNVASTPRAEITGLFGLKLGDQLPARLVRKIDGWQDMAEVGAYCVNPPEPSDTFDTYTVQLLGGPIHKVSASRNGRGQALVNIYDDARKDLTSRFGPPTSTVVVDARGGSGIAWEQNLRYGGRVQMTLTMAKDTTFASGAIIPGTVRLDIQKL